MTAGPPDLVLAVDVGGTTTKAEITDAAGTVLTTGTIPTPHGPAAFDAIEDLGDRLLTELPAAQRIRVDRAAVVLPGIVDPVGARAVFSSNIGWRDVPLGDRFTARWRVPVLLEHDVTVAGWAEWRHGAGRGHDNVCVLILGTGLAGILAVAGRLIRSGPGEAGEYGHIPIRPHDGLPCPCGNVGCVETVAAGGAIARAYTARTGHDIPSAATVFERAPHDPIARAVIDDAVDALATGLLGILHATRVDLIVLGGGLSGAGDILTTALHTDLSRRLRVVPVPAVTLGAFGIRAGLIGAAHYARAGALE
ncbi:ROK family protein [Nocardia aurantia]|uniref:Glucokinase n=1 Tax=Nocardia aurantia TaxID=2585199 RepID=A0A7K0DX42_9NOCA|nr:ROK family protein [Nocardia aurantia]MQY30107.1 Glucokinase [Nocardia aurantia]